MENSFNYEKVSAQAVDFLKEKLDYTTFRHYRSRWYAVKEYMDRSNIEFINPEVCKKCLLEIYNGRRHVGL